MRRLRFQSEDVGVVAEGLMLTDGRVVVQSTRVVTSPIRYQSIEEVCYDWRGAVLEWVDLEAAVAP